MMGSSTVEEEEEHGSEYKNKPQRVVEALSFLLGHYDWQPSSRYTTRMMVYVCVLVYVSCFPYTVTIVVINVFTMIMLACVIVHISSDVFMIVLD